MTIGWGVAGPGSIAERFAQGMALLDDGEIVAVGSRSRARADAFADRFGIPNRHDSYDDLARDPDVEVVYVATPHAQHMADTLRFLQAGKHVLCEKPFALSARQGRLMVEAAQAGGLFLMEAMWSRFLPSYRALADVLSQGRIGEPLIAEADFGFRMPVMPEHRLFNVALGGGALLDLGVYPVQLCSMVFGQPDRVVANGHVGATGVDEQTAAVLHYADGQLGVVKAAIRANLANAARISGSEGWIDVPAFMHHPDHITVTTPSGSETIDGSFDGDGLRFQAMEVHRCIEAGLIESPTMPLDETVSIAATLDAIRVQLGVAYPSE